MIYLLTIMDGLRNSIYDQDGWSHFQIDKNLNQYDSSQHSLQEEVRVITLQLMALQGKVEQSIPGKNYD